GRYEPGGQSGRGRRRQQVVGSDPAGDVAEGTLQVGAGRGDDVADGRLEGTPAPPGAEDDDAVGQGVTQGQSAVVQGPEAVTPTEEPGRPLGGEPFGWGDVGQEPFHGPLIPEGL